MRNWKYAFGGSPMSMTHLQLYVNDADSDKDSTESSSLEENFSSEDYMKGLSFVARSIKQIVAVQ